MPFIHEPVIPARATGVRLDALDLLRGAAMIVMALDHVREFVGRESFLFDPTDLTKTHGMLFLTRWITHFCAPIFFFLAGSGAFLSLGRGKTKPALSWFLLTRGLWLVFLELTLVQFGWSYRIDPHAFEGGVIWALGWSMVLLAALIHLPLWSVAAFGAVMIAGHNLLDPVRSEVFGEWRWLWTILHVKGPVEIPVGYKFSVLYPLIPWIGVMAAGYAFGPIFRRDRDQRRPILLWLGTALILAFVVIRGANGYGDPHPWSSQKTALFTVFSYVNCVKYPPSLLYLLMTLGPALVAVAVFDRDLRSWARPIVVFGRVPLFFYVLHLPLIHLLAELLSYLKYGHFFAGPPWGPEALAVYPKDYGYELPGVYTIWLLAVALLYPLCRWFADVKKRQRAAWLSYF